MHSFETPKSIEKKVMYSLKMIRKGKKLSQTDLAREMNVSRELVGAMLGKSETIESALDLILISRHVERIADHAASIAAEVIFMVSGRDIRHQRKESSTVS